VRCSVFQVGGKKGSTGGKEQGRRPRQKQPEKKTRKARGGGSTAQGKGLTHGK